MREDKVERRGGGGAVRSERGRGRRRERGEE